MEQAKDNRIYSRPFLMEFSKIGNQKLGYISVAENNTLPFEVKRVYWTYFTPESVERGGHAHYELEQLLIATSGKIIVNTEIPGGIKDQFILDSPNVGVFIPKFCWHIMEYSHNAVQMCIANMVYEESDYVRDFAQFKQIK